MNLGGKNGSDRAVKVDVAVVAKRYLASEPIGSSFSRQRRRDRIAGRHCHRPEEGRRLVALPYDSLKIDDTGERIEMPDASKEELSKLTRDL
jgi:hypothetical protein